MVIMKEGLNRIRDLVYDDIINVQLGIGTTPPSFNDSELETPLPTSIKIPTPSKTDLSIKQEQIYTVSEVNGSAISEYVVRMNTSSSDLLGRYVFTPYTKTSSEQFTLRTSQYFTTD